MVSSTAYCQVEDYFLFVSVSEEDWSMRKIDSTGFYVPLNGDTSIVRFYSQPRGQYKHFENGTLIFKGEILGFQGVDHYYKNGKWIEFYSNGNKKTESYFYRNYLIGDYFEYYPCGKIKEKRNYSIISDENGFYDSLLSGGVYSYYENGGLKTIKMFGVKQDTIIIKVYDFDTDKIIDDKRILGFKSVETGIWYSFDEDGKLLNVEEKRD